MDNLGLLDQERLISIMAAVQIMISLRLKPDSCVIAFAARLRPCRHSPAHRSL